MKNIKKMEKKFIYPKNYFYTPRISLNDSKWKIYNTSNNNLIGGGITAPAKYIKMPHYQRWVMFRAYSTTQYVPGAQRKMGEHVTISSGADLIVVLTEPVHLIHSVMNF